jgi:hypothetical protein
VPWAGLTLPLPEVWLADGGLSDMRALLTHRTEPPLDGPATPSLHPRFHHLPHPGQGVPRLPVRHRAIFALLLASLPAGFSSNHLRKLLLKLFLRFELEEIGS